MKCLARCHPSLAVSRVSAPILTGYGKNISPSMAMNDKRRHRPLLYCHSISESVFSHLLVGCLASDLHVEQMQHYLEIELVIIHGYGISDIMFEQPLCKCENAMALRVVPISTPRTMHVSLFQMARPLTMAKANSKFQVGTTSTTALDQRRALDSADIQIPSAFTVTLGTR